MNLQLAFHFLNRPPRHIHRKPQNVVRYQLFNRPCHRILSATRAPQFPILLHSIVAFSIRSSLCPLRSPCSLCKILVPCFLFPARRFLQLLDFFSRERPKPPGLQIQNQRPHPHTPNLLHQMPYALKHSPNLPVPPFNQNHFVPRIFPILEQPYLRRRSFHSPPILQLNHNPRAQPLNPLLIRLPAHLHQISLRHVRPSLHHSLRQRPIIRHQKQTFARIIQTPHGIHAPYALAQNIHHRRPPLRIARGRHITLRLIQHKIKQLLRPSDRRAIHANNIPLQIRFRPQLTHNNPIERHAPRYNNLFRLAPRRHSASRYNFLQSLKSHQREFSCKRTLVARQDRSSTRYFSLSSLCPL